MAESVPDIEHKDIVVIGAGFFGLATASAYLRTNPGTSLLVIDKSSSIGGVWAAERLYPTLTTNNVMGAFEFPDFPMNDENMNGNLDVKPGEHIPGEVIHRYLLNYAKREGLVGDRMRLAIEVELAVKIDGNEKDHEQTGEGKGWILHVKSVENGDSYRIIAKKLVVATGLTSEPFVPELPGEKHFNAPIVHVRDLKKRSEELFSLKDIVILGGRKSAWDAAYAFATSEHDINVTMVIRASGHGTPWMSPAYVTPWRKAIEDFFMTRLLTFMSPCIWGDAGGYSSVKKFLHTTKVGNLIVRRFWKLYRRILLAETNYDNHPETRKLKPWSDPFWVCGGLSILNYETDFFELVRTGRIKVVVGDIQALKDHTVIIGPVETGNKKWKMEKHWRDIQVPQLTSFPADALIYSTGWRSQPPIKFVSAKTGKDLDATLGLPHRAVGFSEVERSMMEKADREILAKFPMLGSPPRENPFLKAMVDPRVNGEADEPPSITIKKPFCLYRAIVPPLLINDRSIVFNGEIQSGHTPLVSAAQALWTVAYLNNRILSLQQKSSAEIVYESVVHSRFAKWRCPGAYGTKYLPALFEALGYVDLLLHDCGVENRRKTKRGKSELLEPYGSKDYVGLLEEWQQKNQELMAEAIDKGKKT